MDLGQLIRIAGKLEKDDAVGWTLRLARSLALLHGRGRVHGRICPEAIVTAATERRAPAMLLEPPRCPVRPPYHCAARAAGAPPSPADDVWAAGVMLYYGLTGALPFRGETDEQVKTRIEWAPSRPLTKHGCDAPRVQRILDRIFAPYRVERIVTAHDLQVVLSRCLSDKERLAPIDVPDSTAMAAHHVSASPDAPSQVPEDASVVMRMPPPDTSSASVLDAWLEDREGPADESAELSSWMHGEVPESQQPPSGHAVAQLVAEVERAADRDEAPASDEMIAPPSSQPLSPRPAREAEAPEPSRPATSLRVSRRLRGSSRWLVWVAAAAAVAALYMAFRQRTRSPAPKPVASAASSARPSAASSASVTVPASVSSATYVRDACIAKLLAGDTFAGDAPSFEALCRADDPRAGAQAVKTVIVAAGEGRSVTEGMKEWSGLGWYEMAAFTIVHGRCCGRPMALPKDGPYHLCDIGDALIKLHEAAESGDRRAVGKSVDVYRRAARCAARLGLSDLFGQTARPTPQQLAVLQKMMTRLPP